VNSERAAEIDLLFELAAALQRVGTGTARVEETLAAVAQALGFDAHFFVLPDSVWATLTGDGVEITRLIPAPGGQDNLAQLDALRGLSGRLIDGAVGTREARRELAMLAVAPPTWGPRAVIAAFGAVSVGAAVLFGGGAAEAVVAGLIGLGIGWLADRSAAWRLGRLFEVLAALQAAFVATAGAATFGLAVDLTVLAGIVVLVPGFTIHRGMTDLSTGMLVSGTTRMAQAGTSLMLMGFGVALGAHLGEAGFGAPTVLGPTPGPGWLPTASIVLMTPALLVLFQAPARAVGWILGSVLIAWFGSHLGAELLGPQLGAFVAALGVGVYANLWERLLDRPAAIPLAPGLLLLVPGVVGFRGVSALLSGEPLAAIETGFAALLVAVSLVCGLLTANVLLGPAPRSRARGMHPAPETAPDVPGTGF